MSDNGMPGLQGVLVEQEVQFTLVELSVACRAETDQVAALVAEGVIPAHGEDPRQWRFDGSALKRTRTALRLMHDLELSVSGTAVVLDLLEQIETLRARLRQLGER